MRNLNTQFCSLMLKGVKERVKEYCIKKGIPYKQFVKHSWGYKYSRSDDGEFHINKNQWLPKGFYWYGKVESVTDAKAEGWQAFLDEQGGEE